MRNPGPHAFLSVARWLVLAMAVVGTGCRQHRGQLVVVVDGSVPDMNIVRIETGPPGQSFTDAADFPIGVTPAYRLPLSLVVQARDTPGGDVEVVVRVRGPSMTPLERVIVRNLVPNETRVLRVTLGACLNPTECSATVEFSNLPQLRPGTSEFEVGGSDASDLDAAPMDAPPRDASVDAPIDVRRDGGGAPVLEGVVIESGLLAVQRFGASAALNATGDRLLVGIPMNDPTSLTGAAQLYDGAGTPLQRFTGPHRFGASVAMARTACRGVVGAPGYDGDRGAWTIVDCDGTSSMLYTADAVSTDALGTSVGISADGERVIVGAPRDGYAVFASGDGNLLSRALGDDGITARSGGELGSSVAMADDGAALLGAPAFRGTAGDVLAVQAGSYVATVIPIADAGTSFGTSVAISGDGLWGAVSGVGFVGVFHRDTSDTAWMAFHTVLLTIGQAPVVALDSDGTRLVMGNAVSNQAWLVSRTGATFSEPFLLTSALIETGNDYGFSVAISADGNVIAVGAPGAGRVHLYTTP